MICRLCLIDLNAGNSVALFNLFGSYNDLQLLKAIEKYLHLDITWSDEISNTICQSCCKYLKDFDKYCAYIREQQILLSQRVPILDDLGDASNAVTKLNVEPVRINVKSEPHYDVTTMEIAEYSQGKCSPAQHAQVKCEPEKVVAATAKQLKCLVHDDVPTIEVELKSERVEAVATTEQDLKCIADSVDDDLTMEAELKCEPEEANFTEMTLLSSMVSNDSAYKGLSSSLCQQNISNNFSQVCATRNIEDSSISNDFMSDKQVQFIPDAISIKLLQPLQEIYKSFLLGNPLDENDRTIIAETVIEECLKNLPEKVLKCFDFAKIADNIIEVFPSEDVTTYYLWHTSRRPASGKLFYAYNRQLASSVKTKVRTKSKKKKMPMTSTERSRKHRAKKLQAYRKLYIERISSAYSDGTLENADSQLSVESMEYSRTNAPDMQDIARLEMHVRCVSDDDVLTRTETKMKKKPMTSAERSRNHRTNKFQCTYMENSKLDSSANIDDSLDTSMVPMEMLQKCLSEEDVLTKTRIKTEMKKKSMSSTERSRICRARKYNLYNMESVKDGKISSSASIDGTLESVVKATWF